MKPFEIEQPFWLWRRNGCCLSVRKKWYVNVPAGCLLHLPNGGRDYFVLMHWFPANPQQNVQYIQLAFQMGYPHLGHTDWGAIDLQFRCTPLHFSSLQYIGSVLCSMDTCALVTRGRQYTYDMVFLSLSYKKSVNYRNRSLHSFSTNQKTIPLYKYII